jgi:hypothetical protein
MSAPELLGNDWINSYIRMPRGITAARTIVCTLPGMGLRRNKKSEQASEAVHLSSRMAQENFSGARGT